MKQRKKQSVCMNEEDLQRYIDGALSFQEKIYTADHILKCESCAGRVEQGVNRKLAIIKSLDDLADNGLSHIPEFIPNTTRNRMVHPRILRPVVILAAASLVLAILIPCLWWKQEGQEQIIIVQDYSTEVDANRPITEQEVVFKMVDENGSITEWEIPQE